MAVEDGILREISTGSVFESVAVIAIVFVDDGSALSGSIWLSSCLVKAEAPSNALVKASLENQYAAAAFSLVRHRALVTYLLIPCRYPN